MGAENSKKKYSLSELQSFYEVVKPGDILKFPAEFFSHYAIYIGNYKEKRHCVVHFCIPRSNIEDFYREYTRSSENKNPLLREKFFNKCTLCITSVEEVFTDLNYTHVLISNDKDGKCHVFTREEIVNRALDDYKNRYNLEPYHFFRNNCEHFVNKIRYGKPKSSQSDIAAGVGMGLVFGALAVVDLAVAISSEVRKGKKSERERNQKKNICREIYC